MVENDIAKLETQLPLYDPEIRRAYEFAAYWHGKIGQVRKGSGVPYIVHPMRVAIAGVKRDSSAREICVRLNHDVKEDVEILGDDVIIQSLGIDTYLGIRWLTGPDDSDPKLKKLSRRIRHRVYHEQLAFAPYHWKLVKLDDRVDNLNDANDDDEFFKTTYVDETGELLEALSFSDTITIKNDPAYKLLEARVAARGPKPNA